jgi:homocysteine S-methyltransferase
MKLVHEMNIENFQSMPICFGGAIDAGKKGIEAEIKKTIRKMEAGAKFFLTQPIFEDRAIENLKLIKKETGAKILAGIMPIVSYKNARFMDNEIPGINIPSDIMERFEKVVSREDGEKVGEEVALEVIKKIDKIVDGYYFMVPFNRVYIISRILQMLKSEVIG